MWPIQGRLDFPGEDVYYFHLGEGLPYVENLRITLAVPHATPAGALGPAAGRPARTGAHQRR